MNGDHFQTLWNQPQVPGPKWSRDTLDGYLGRTARRDWYGLRISVWVSVVLLAVGQLVHLLNLAASTHSALWLALHATLALSNLVFVAFGLHLLRKLRTIDDPTESLMTLIRRQLQFFQTTMPIWMWIWSLSLWMLSFGLVVWVENREGGYRIGHAWEFVAVSLAMVFGMYAIQRLGYYPLIRRSLAVLRDLEAQVTDETERAESQRKYWVLGVVVLLVALLAAVGWTIHLWWSASQP